MRFHFCITASLLLGCIHAQNAQAASLWEHNGSTVSLTADGSTREFHYDQPRPGMLQAGARPGSLLFTGKSVNGHYVGTANIFNSHCGQIPYQVSGPILDHHERVVLKGQAPRLDSDCEIVGYFSDTLEFSHLKSAKATRDVLKGHAEITPAPLNKGANLRVVNVGTNDVLHMKEYPTENSHVIQFIPPDGTGIVYQGYTQEQWVGYTHEQWVFVQYEHANGWVNRVFVEPIVPRGGKF
jgi:hypothetical protein